MRAKKEERSMAIKRKLTAEELDALHDSGEDMTPYLKVEEARRPGRETQF
jgi:hypothetical protein